MLEAEEFGVTTHKTHVAGAHLLVGPDKTHRYTGLIPKISPLAILSLVRANRRIDKMARTVPVEAPWTADRAAEWDKRSVADWMAQCGVRSGLAMSLFDTAVRGLFTGDLADVSLLNLLFLAHAHGSIETLFSIEGGAQENLVDGGAGAIAARMAEVLGDDKPKRIGIMFPSDDIEKVLPNRYERYAGGLLTLESQGGAKFFGEPALKLSDLLIADEQGRGAIHVLAAEKLFGSPMLYATFLLWLLSELYEQLPEVGDLEKPRLVFFFDEAHLLFDDAPKALLDQVQQVVRLIRSKGVGIYFITQSPLDIPDNVLGQLGNKVQHALRAFTPKDRKSVKAVADNFRENPNFKASDAVQELAVGEALVSTLDTKGIPAIVDRVFITPPTCRMGSITPDERRAVMAASPVKGVYDETVDRESAYEILIGRAQAATASSAPSASQGPAPARRTWGGGGAAPAQPEASAPRRPQTYPMPQTPREAPAPRASNAITR